MTSIWRMLMFSAFSGNQNSYQLFDKQDLEAFAKEHGNTNDELDDEDLEKFTGGGLRECTELQMRM